MILKYHGVHKIKRYQGFTAQITINGKNTNLGTRKTAREAAILYDIAAIKQGKYDKLNILKALKS